jgi:dihydrofolate reductase/thymidylate synthase
MFDIIVAINQDNVIGQVDKSTYKIPWYCPTDIQFFKNKTTYTEYPTQKNVIIMGTNTFKSINEKPLKNRINCIISRSNKYPNTYQSIDQVIEKYFDDPNIFNIFVIGGAQIYNMAFQSKYLRYVYVTNLITNNINKNCIHLKINYNKLQLISTSKSICENNTIFTFKKYCNPYFSFYKQIGSVHEEYQYLNLLKNILEKGTLRQTRNAITLSTFGHILSFDLNKHFPILTTKRVYWKGVVEELLWFLKGDTNALHLAEKKVNIWLPNTTPQFHKSRNLHNYDIGDVGPMYGFQWLHYGAEYFGMNYNYNNKGLNQLENCINMIKKDPHSRRILMTTYNPSCIKQSVLAPCHGIVIQFYVNHNKLSCHMYQRSSDSFLGLPFNISSYSLLTHIIAKECNLQVDKLHISLGDTHIYKDHITSVKEQLTRVPFKFPQLKFNKKNINNYEYSDFKLINYKSHKTIKAKMIP